MAADGRARAGPRGARPAAARRAAGRAGAHRAATCCMVLDLSRSMTVTDVAPSRLARAKAAAWETVVGVRRRPRRSHRVRRQRIPPAPAHLRSRGAQAVPRRGQPRRPGRSRDRHRHRARHRRQGVRARGRARPPRGAAGERRRERRRRPRGGHGQPPRVGHSGVRARRGHDRRRAGAGRQLARRRRSSIAITSAASPSRVWTRPICARSPGSPAAPTRGPTGRRIVRAPARRSQRCARGRCRPRSRPSGPTGSSGRWPWRCWRCSATWARRAGAGPPARCDCAAGFGESARPRPRCSRCCSSADRLCARGSLDARKGERLYAAGRLRGVGAGARSRARPPTALPVRAYNAGNAYYRHAAVRGRGGALPAARPRAAPAPAAERLQSRQFASSARRRRRRSEASSCSTPSRRTRRRCGSIPPIRTPSGTWRSRSSGWRRIGWPADPRAAAGTPTTAAAT